MYIVRKMFPVLVLLSLANAPKLEARLSQSQLEWTIICGAGVLATYCGYQWYLDWTQQKKLAQRTDQEILSQANQYYADLLNQKEIYLSMISKFEACNDHQERKALKQELVKQIVNKSVFNYPVLGLKKRLREEVANLQKHTSWIKERCARLQSKGESKNLELISQSEVLIEKITTLSNQIRSLILLIEDLPRYRFEKLIHAIKTIKSDYYHTLERDIRLLTYA